MAFLNGPHSITDSLPPSHVVVEFSGTQNIKDLTSQIAHRLAANHFHGNQFLLITRAPSWLVDYLDDEVNPLDVSYRLQWNGSTVLLKVIPGFYGVPTQSLVTFFNVSMALMDRTRYEGGWGGRTTYVSGNTGKHADTVFWPEHRRPMRGNPPGWPSLVIESGVSESLCVLRNEAKWWFNSSEGQVRIVILISIGDEVVVERWQLAPPDAPYPMCKEYLRSLREQTDIVVPPLVSQPAISQQCYCVQKVTVKPDHVEGAPMIIPFQGLLDRSPQPNETDFSIEDHNFRWIVRPVL